MMDDLLNNVVYSRSRKPPPKLAFLRVNSSTVSNMGSVQDQEEFDRQNIVPEDDLLYSPLVPSSCQNSVDDRSRIHTSSFWQFIRRFGDYLAYATLLTMLCLVPIVLYRALSNKKLDIAAFSSAWVLMCGTIVLSVRLVYLHLTHWYMPEVQKYVVRILWMVPIYAIQSYLSLRYHQHRVYLSTIRDFYEAYVITSFVYYLIEILGGQDSLVELLQQKDPSVGQHTFPISLMLEPWELGLEFMLQCKHGVLQYVVFKTTATILTFLCEFAGIYGEGTFNWFVAYPYLCFFQNISVMYALYCLVVLFHAVQDELRSPVDWHPLGKFLCIKGVVFFTWWQGVLIFYLRDHGIIDRLGSWSSLEVANGLIDYCIVIEMVGFAIAHSYTFTYREYLPGRLPASMPVESSAVVANGDAETNGNGLLRSQSSSYRPPATLNRPMKFKEALWSSTVPKETIEDIQRLRAGVDGALNHANRPRAISLQQIDSGELVENPSVQQNGSETSRVDKSLEQF